jgi:hypothetical protein
MANLKKFTHRAGALVAGAALATGLAVLSTPAQASTTGHSTGVVATPQVSSCFAARPDVPYYSWPAWRDRGVVTYLGKVGQGQGIYWYGTTYVNGYAYVIGTLWGGPGDVMMPKIYLNC